MANNLSRAKIPSRLNPTAKAFEPSLRSPLSIWSPLDKPSTCWLWAEEVAQAEPDGEGESRSSRPPPENVLSLSKESTIATTSIISELSMGGSQQHEGGPERNFLAAGLDPPDKTIDERLMRQLKIISLKDYLVRHYVKSLRVIPMKLEDTLEVIKAACTDILAFEGVIISSSVGGSNNDFTEAVKNILKAVAKQESMIDVLTKSINNLDDLRSHDHDQEEIYSTKPHNSTTVATVYLLRRQTLPYHLKDHIPIIEIMSSSNITLNHESQSKFATNEPTVLSAAKLSLLSTAPQLLLENSVANLWAAVKMAETTLNESSHMLVDAPTSENIAIVVVAQTQLAAQLAELRFAMKVDFKHAGADDLLKRGLNPDYQVAKN
ncbi:hypothetical protein MMC17_002394 [Xylographa soralifera]|nr:hypothetical protein [Xylographa soralifera]